MAPPTGSPRAAHVNLDASAADKSPFITGRTLRLEKKGFRSRDAFTIYTQERIAQLYAVGYDAAEIYRIVVQEFQDIELYPIPLHDITQYILKNKELLEVEREKIGLALRQEYMVSMQDLFVSCTNHERRVGTVLVAKMAKLTDNIEKISLEMDEEGKIPGLEMFSILMKALKDVHGTISKIAGLDVARELELFQQKANISLNMKMQVDNMKNGGYGGPPLDATTGKPLPEQTTWVETHAKNPVDEAISLD